MGQYLIDTNVISSYFSGNLSHQAINFISKVIDDIPKLSIITQIEALSWISEDKVKEATVEAFIQDANIIGINSEVVNVSVKIRRSRRVRTPDAIIAATAIVHNLSLITSDHDFKKIEGLKVIDPANIN